MQSPCRCFTCCIRNKTKIDGVLTKINKDDKYRHDKYRQQKAGGYIIVNDRNGEQIEKPCMCKWLAKTSERIKLMFIFGIVCLASFTIAIYIFCLEPRKTQALRYDNICKETPCSFDIELKEDFEGPVRFHYKLDNF